MHAIYKLSLKPEAEFPFMTVSINMTQVVMQALRAGALTKMCNKKGGVYEVCHGFHAACYLHMFQAWKARGLTIVDFGYLKNEITALALAHGGATRRLEPACSRSSPAPPSVPPPPARRREEAVCATRGMERGPAGAADEEGGVRRFLRRGVTWAQVTLPTCVMRYTRLGERLLGNIRAGRRAEMRRAWRRVAGPDSALIFYESGVSLYTCP